MNRAILQETSMADFQYWIAGTADLNFVMESKEWWESILMALGGLFDKIYGWIYELMKLDPFWYGLDWATKEYYWKNYKGLDDKDAEDRQERFAKTAIGIIIGIVLAIITWGGSSGISLGSIGIGLVGIGVLTAVELTMMIASALLLALNLGLLAYSGYLQLVSLFETFDMEALANELKLLEEETARAEDAAKPAKASGIVSLSPEISVTLTKVSAW